MATLEPKTARALREQLEFYFSDANLRKDKFLLRLTGPRGTGEVEVGILSTFNRVRALVGNNIDAVQAALQQITGLAVSEDKKYVRRSRELPTDDDTDERTVYVEPLQTGATQELLHQAFGKCGTVTYVALPRLPNGDLKGFAFVEFESADGALAACDPEAVRVAIDALSPNIPNLQVMHKQSWLAMKAEYKRALEHGRHEHKMGQR